MATEKFIRYVNSYNKKNTITLGGIRLNCLTEEHYVDIYKAIPNKAAWIRDCLDRYEKEHPEVVRIYMENKEKGF